MSNHFDGYTAANNAKLDITDVYLFKGETGTVMVANTNTPVSESYTGPGWDTDAVYDHKFDLNGDGYPELALRARFSGHSHDDGSPSAQRWSLSLHVGPGADDPESIGLPLLYNARTDAVHTSLLGVKAFAGLIGEPFYLPFPLVSAVRTSILDGEAIDTSGHNPDTATNAFAGTNVNSIVVEIPNLFGLLDGLTVGYWASVTVPTDDGHCWRQVDRAALPMTTTLYGFNTGDDFNTHRPDEDDERFGPQIEALTEAAVAANGSSDDPAAYAQAVRSRLMPSILNYTIGTDAQLSGGEWNGRNLREDAAGATFGHALNMEFDTGLDSGNATGELRDQFPYVAEPIGP